MSWICSSIYASHNPTLRDELGVHLTNLRQFSVGGIRGEFSQVWANRMLSTVEACEFIDLGATGKKFMWERRLNGRRRVAKRLDRAIEDVSWRHKFLEAYVEHFARVYLDHCPIMARCSAAIEDRLAHSCGFHAAWATRPSFERSVRDTWKEPPISLVGKLNNIRVASLVFNTNVFGNITHKKKSVEHRLQGLQHELEVRET